MPPMMTRSAGLRPDRITRRPPRRSPISTCLGTTVPSGATVMTRCCEQEREHAVVDAVGIQRRGRYWDGYRASGDLEELQRLVEKAVPFIEGGDGSNEVRILEPIAEAFVDDWLEHSFGSDEHLYELFTDLGRLMAEAALMSDLSADERDALAQTLEDWQARLEEYGVDEGFHVAIP